MTARTDALDPRHALDRSARGAATVPAALRELPTRSALVVLVAAWILFGLVGHDPWKPDEAHNFGVVLELLRSHDWVVPTLAGEPWLEKPPLFYVVAATFAAALQNVLPLHDAARLATGFFVAIAALFLGLSGRELYGRGYGTAATLLFVGGIGTIVQLHQLIPDVALVAGIAIGIYGLALARRKVWAAGIALGLGVACAFLSKGLIGPGCLGVTALVLTLFKPWRRPPYGVVLAIAFVVVAIPAAIWTVALYSRSPHFVSVWLIDNNFGRFLGLSQLGERHPPGFYAYTLVWYAMPALPLVLYATWIAWRDRAVRSVRDGLELPAALAGVILMVLAFASDSRDLYLLPIMLPLSLAGARALRVVPSTGTRALGAVSRFGFGIAAVLLWLAWVTSITGLPAWFDERLLSYQPGYASDVHWDRLTLAIAVTIAAAATLARRANTSGLALTQWTVGVTLCWALIATLWTPFLDAGKSYRGMIGSLAHELPTDGCVASLNLGEPQRALLEYFAGVITVRREVTPSAKCPSLLVQGWREANAAPPEDGWTLVWEGSRSGDTKELYSLFVRDASRDRGFVRYPQ